MPVSDQAAVGRRRWQIGSAWRIWGRWSGMVGIMGALFLLIHVVYSWFLGIGRGNGIVIATGTKTEFGIIFEMMQDVRPPLVHSGGFLTLTLLAWFSGRGEANTSPAQHGRPRETSLNHLLRRHRGHLPHRCLTVPILARDVHHRRSAPALPPFNFLHPILICLFQSLSR